MKPVSPHDPLDDLIVAALHGDLSPEERTQFEARLSHDPAAQAAYQEALVMHDLLEKTHRSAQPDPDFEQRMVSGVRRKLNQEKQGEKAWESVLVIWRAATRIPRRSRMIEIVVVFGIIAVLAGVALGPITGGIKEAKQKAAMQAARQAELQQQAFAMVQTPTQQTTDQAKQIPPAAGGVANVNEPDDAPASPPPVAKSLVSDYLAKAYLTKAQPSPPASPAPDATTDSSTPVAPIADSDGAKAKMAAADASSLVDGSMPASSKPAPEVADGRKLIRNAQLDLEVKSYQGAVDQITALTKSAGGYVDTSNSDRGGNGKLEGTVVVKILPQNLDDFLLKLRDLGTVDNQSVSTEDVTKDYVDTQARLDNSRRMETQLQDLLAHQNSKVSDLLMVERELERVRGDIEQMQGQLKLYDFEVQYATVTIQLHEKDLNQAAAYLLKEQDDFTLYSTDVEGTFQKAKQAADDFKAEILAAQLNHNSPSDISALVVAMVPPDQIEPFLDRVRTLGRVSNFTRNTRREAKDGGDTNDPADQTRTDRDKVLVNVSIHPDDDSRKQVALTVVAKAVDNALEQAKSAALAQAGTEILGSSLDTTPQGASTAQLSVRVPGKEYAALLGAFQGLGRTGSLSIQRNDSAGPGANGDDEPVIVALSLTDDDTPMQHTELAVVANDVDAESVRIKQQAASTGVEVKASSYERQPDGTETAQMTFCLPMSAYPAFMESLKKLGKVESLTVQRDDRPDQAQTDDTAPAEIALTLHDQGEIVPDNSGVWPTLRETFGEGAGALFGSVKTIGVLIAFVTPWLITVFVAAWVGRRIYLWRRNK